MQRLIVSILSLALTFASFIARASGDARTTELLAQARAALGGEPRLAKVQGLSAAGTFQRQAGERQLQGELTVDVQLPDKMVRTESMNPIGDATIVVLQGVFARRPSRLHVRVEFSGGDVSGVKVGGTSAVVGEGTASP